MALTELISKCEDEMHRIERLSPATRSSIRNQIYRVLAQYASGGNHGPISVKKLFLMTADGLVDSGTIERPDFLGGRGLGGQKFVQLTEGRQPKIFPDYEIPNEIANLMRQTFWELFLQGILAPAPKRNPLEDSVYPEKHQDFWLYLDYVMLTPYGVSHGSCFGTFTWSHYEPLYRVAANLYRESQ